MPVSTPIRTVLGVAPCPVGFGFVVLETRGKLVTWGIARLYSNNDEEFLQRLDALISRYEVEILGVEDIAGTMRSSQTKRRIGLTVDYAARLRLPVLASHRVDIRRRLELPARAAKLAIAQQIAEVLPELASYLPSARRAWSRETNSMKLFEAAGLALGVLATELGDHFN